MIKMLLLTKKMIMMMMMMLFYFILVDQCRCGVERADTKRNSFNRIIGGQPIDKVGVKLFQT